MAKEKKITAYIKLQVAAGAANPAPPVGPALGQHGLNIQEFCKSFNDKTSDIEKGMPIPVIITVYADRTFKFELKTPPASVLIKKALNLKSGSATPHSNKVGKLTQAQVKEIAEMKLKDLNTGSVENAMRSIAGTARSMGIDVES